MPTYDYDCPTCGKREERVRPIALRDDPAVCNRCACVMERVVAAPLGRVRGVVPKGGGMDRFTADMLGIPVKELPAGLRHADKDRAK